MIPTRRPRLAVRILPLHLERLPMHLGGRWRASCTRRGPRPPCRNWAPGEVMDPMTEAWRLRVEPPRREGRSRAFADEELMRNDLPRWRRALERRPTELHLCPTAPRLPLRCSWMKEKVNIPMEERCTRMAACARRSGEAAARRTPWPIATALCGGDCAGSNGLAVGWCGQLADHRTRRPSRWTNLGAGRVSCSTGRRSLIRCTLVAVRAHRDLLTTVSCIVLRAVVIAMGKHSLGMLQCWMFGNGLAMSSGECLLGVVDLPMAPVAPPARAPLTECWSSRPGA